MIRESKFDGNPLVIEHFDHSSFYESVMHDLEIRKTIGIGISGFIFMILRRSHKEESK